MSITNGIYTEGEKQLSILYFRESFLNVNAGEGDGILLESLSLF